MKSDDKSNNADGQESASEVGARIRARAAELHISRSNLINWTNIRKQTFAGYWNGDRVPPAHALLQLSEELDVSPKWLLTGEGPLDPHPPREVRQTTIDQSNDTADLVEVAEIDLSFGLGAAFMDEQAMPQVRSFSRAWLRQITTSSPSELYWARGRGDSMKPTISEGEVVLIDRSQQSPRDADLIWAFAWGDLGAIKRLRPLPDGSVKILSDNEAVPPETAVDGEIHVFGRVVAVVKKL